VLSLDQSANKQRPVTEESLVELLDVSKKMLELARAGEWLEVVTLEEQREVMLKNIFESEHAAHLKPEFIRNKIEQVMSCDQQLVVLAKAAQQEIVLAVGHLAKSRHGLSEYHQNQDL
jgi:hypothetical protein